ncbi:MAG TPA: SAM-dependent methyltransferase [Erythrobacter sp.]|nr:SAM-dependent methyltransferase [Erythrobacter sp.]
MNGSRSLGADYFEGIFTSDEDPWGLATSDYERRKFDRTIAVLQDRRYASALEVGCAQGVLTERLHDLCDHLLAIDISETALRRAKQRLGNRSGIEFATMGFPGVSPGATFDLCVLSEVAYYWDRGDLTIAARWMTAHLASGARALLVHYTGPTDYPCSADEAVWILKQETSGCFTSCVAERHASYRLDLWERR